MEQFLRESLGDPTGKMEVGEQGPIWAGQEKLAGLSYSNTSGWGVVVFSRSIALGVDLELAQRPMKESYLKIAKRFFHETEYRELEATSPLLGQSVFLDLWTKKEAYSKLKRRHLVEFIKDPLPDDVRFEALPKTRHGYQAVVAYQSN